MDKWGGYLRVTTTNTTIHIDSVNWTSTNEHKVYVLEIPTIQNGPGPGQLTLVGETEKLADDNGYIAGSLFVRDKAYISVSSNSDEKNHFVTVDLTDPANPHAVGILEVSLICAYTVFIAF